MAVRETDKRPWCNEIRGIESCFFMIGGPERCSGRDWERFSNDGGTGQFGRMMTSIWCS